jgi:hypothetical protein
MKPDKLYFFMDELGFRLFLLQETPFVGLYPSLKTCVMAAKKDSKGPFNIYVVDPSNTVRRGVRKVETWTDEKGEIL